MHKQSADLATANPEDGCMLLGVPTCRHLACLLHSDTFAHVHSVASQAGGACLAVAVGRDRLERVGRRLQRVHQRRVAAAVQRSAQLGDVRLLAAGRRSLGMRV